MANIMTKRGNQDNVITYEHICDTSADMANIEPQYKTLGSVCIVIQGASGGLEVYITGSNKEWVPITEIAGGSGSGNTTVESLPSVTAQDEGKVLTVVNGAWDKANASGGSFVVPVFTVDAEENITCNMTYEEIYAAVSAGKCSHCLVKTFEDGDYVWDTFILYDSWEGNVRFMAVRLLFGLNDRASIGQSTITVTEEEITIDYQNAPIPSA